MLSLGIKYDYKLSVTNVIVVIVSSLVQYHVWDGIDNKNKSK